MNTNVILLNADYTTLGIINWRKAIKLICKKKVEVVKSTEIVISNYERTVKMLIPAIIRLIKYVRSIFGKRVPFNKRNVLLRDGNVCQYCGVKLNNITATIDHVMPKSKGGLSEFTNTVSACLPCNNKKDNRRCSEANMCPRKKPVSPTIMEFILIQIKHLGMEETLKELGII